MAWLEAILRGQGPIDLHLGCSTFVVSRSLDVDRILKRERIAVLLVGPARSGVTIHWSVIHCGVLISITICIYIYVYLYCIFSWMVWCMFVLGRVVVGAMGCYELGFDQTLTIFDILWHFCWQCLKLRC